MRSIGQGHDASMKSFCALMNMPSSMQFKAYRACNIALSKAASATAMKSMNVAAQEIRGEKTLHNVESHVMEHGKDVGILH